MTTMPTPNGPFGQPQSHPGQGMPPAYPAHGQQQSPGAPIGEPYGHHLSYGQAQSPYGQPTTYPTRIAIGQPLPKPVKLGKMAWSAIILGIIGIVGSIIPILNNLTAIAAVLGGIFGVVALFGSRRIAASIGIVLCTLAIVFTVMAQQAFSKELEKNFGAAAPASVAHLGR
jgi:hypothetical protein